MKLTRLLIDLMANGKIESGFKNLPPKQFNYI